MEEMPSCTLDKTLRSFEHLERGDHLCGLYFDQEEKVRNLFQFIVDGLAANDCVFFIEDDVPTRELVLAKVNELYPIEPLKKSGKLLLSSSGDAYLKEGQFSAEKMIESFSQLATFAKGEGYTKLRVTAEPSWIPQRGSHSEADFILYESAINNFFLHSDSLALCQYSLHSSWSTHFLQNVLLTHPLALIGNELFENFYYVPTEEFLCEQREDNILERKLQNLLARKRIEDKIVKAKEDALAASLTKSRFLAMVSHEIRTPLNGIIGLSDVLLQTVKDPSHWEAIRIISVSGKHLMNVLEDVLSLAQVERGSLALVPGPLYLPQCLEEAVKICIPQANIKEISMKIVLMEEGVKVSEKWMTPMKELSSDQDFKISKDRSETEEPPRNRRRTESKLLSIPEWWIEADKTRLKQTIVNLLGNALKFSKEGTITLRANLDLPKGVGTKVTISVEDQGVGIPSDKLEDIFGAFTQVDNSSTRNYGGTGLGLSISKQFVEMWGGTIWVTSEEGKGSEFTFTLPTKTVSVDQMRDGNLLPPEPPTDISNLKILVAEDNLTNQKVLAKMLTHIGNVNFDIVSNGEEAISKASQTKYDAVLMDLFMPICDGWTATKELKKLPNDVRPSHVYALSASLLHGKETEEQPIFDGFLAKPLGLSTLLDALRECI